MNASICPRSPAVGFLHKAALASPELADALHVLHANYVQSVPDPD